MIAILFVFMHSIGYEDQFYDVYSSSSKWEPRGSSLSRAGSGRQRNNSGPRWGECGSNGLLMRGLPYKATETDIQKVMI